MQKYRTFILSFFITLVILISLWSGLAVISACETRIHGEPPALRLELPCGDDRFYLTVGEDIYRIEAPTLVAASKWISAHSYLLPAPLQFLSDLNARSSA